MVAYLAIRPGAFRTRAGGTSTDAHRTGSCRAERLRLRGSEVADLDTDAMRLQCIGVVAQHAGRILVAYGLDEALVLHQERVHGRLHDFSLATGLDAQRPF